MLNPSVKHRRVEGRRKNVFIVPRPFSHSVLFPISSCYRTYSERVAGSLGWREQQRDSLACLNYKWKNIINCNLCQFHLLSLSVHATATDASTINSLHLVITRIPLTRNPNSNVSSAYTTHISYLPHIWVRGEQEKKTNKIKYTLFHVDWIDSEWLKVAYIVYGLDVQNGISPAGTSGRKEVNCTILSKIETYLRKKSLRILKFNREILAHSVVPIGFHNPFIHRTYCYSPTRILYTHPRPPNTKLRQPLTRKNVIIPV